MSEFLRDPGSEGATGALLDEYAKAAGEFCDVVERFDPEAFESVRHICHHVGRATYGYAIDLRRAFGLESVAPGENPAEAIRTPADVRPLLIRAMHYTEEAVEPMRPMSERQVMERRFVVSWGATYDPEQLLEHAICHLLRHRRQLERRS